MLLRDGELQFFALGTGEYNELAREWAGRGASVDVQRVAGRRRCAVRLAAGIPLRSALPSGSGAAKGKPQFTRKGT